MNALWPVGWGYLLCSFTFITVVDISVLAEERPLEAPARLAGAVSSRDVSSWGWLFRKCLDVIALATGFIFGLRQLHRTNGRAEQDPADDPARHADSADLADPRLRRGRPNGR